MNNVRESPKNREPTKNRHTRKSTKRKGPTGGWELRKRRRSNGKRLGPLKGSPYFYGRTANKGARPPTARKEKKPQRLVNGPTVHFIPPRKRNKHNINERKEEKPKRVVKLGRGKLGKKKNSWESRGGTQEKTRPGEKICTLLFWKYTRP